MLFLLLLILCSFAALILQTFIPPLPWLHGAHVHLMPIVMFYGCFALPYPAAMTLTFCCGLMWDLMTVQVVDSSVEISLGWSIISYSILGSMMHGFRPLYLEGRWEVHTLLTGVFTSLALLVEYLDITFRRQGLHFPAQVWWLIGGTGLVATILSPFFYWLLERLAAWVRYEPEPLPQE
ncbi:MAG TPA: hypothetical protein VIT21_10745 [Chthoniobacterales bacterium]